MGRESVVTHRGIDRLVTQAPRFVEPAEQQTGATQRVVGPGGMADDSPRRLVLNELLAFPDPVQRLARFVEQRQYPGGVGDREGKLEDDVPCPKRCIACSSVSALGAQAPLWEWTALSAWPTMVFMVCRSASRSRGFVLGRLCELQFGELCQPGSDRTDGGAVRP